MKTPIAYPPYGASRRPPYRACRHESPPLDIVAPDDTAEELDVSIFIVMISCGRDVRTNPHGD